MPDEPQAVVACPSEGSASAADAIAEGGAPAASDALLEVIRECVGGALVQWLEELFSQAAHDLVVDAGNGFSDGVIRDRYDAVQELPQFKSALQESFVGLVLGALEQLWKGEPATQVASQSDADEGDVEQLSLMRTQVLEDEVLVATTTVRAAAALRTGEYELEYRLSQLLALAHLQSHPMSAQSICLAFYQAVKSLGAESTSRRALFRALNKTIVGRLGALHKELNTLLVSHGVCPHIRYTDRRLMAERRSLVSQPPAVGHSASSERPSGSGPSDADSVTAEMQHAPVTPLASWTPAWEVSAQTVATLPFAAACQSVWRLMHLEREVGTARASTPSPAHGPDPNDHSTIETALARIQRSGEATSWGKQGPYAFGVRVRDALEKQGVKIDDAAIADTLDVVAALLETILEDALVQGGAKPFIRQLGLPLCRAALGDATFLASDVHPARQMINQLGHLAVSSGDDAKEGAGCAPQPIARVVKRVLDAPRADRETFSRATEDLAVLLEQQRAHFQQSVQGLVETLDRQQAILMQKRGGVEAKQASLIAAEVAHVDWQQTLEAVSRLAIGDVVVLFQGPATPVPATLVWRRDDGGILVFADALGRRAASFGRRELAMALRRGTARLDEAPSMPIVDRAMCRVLQDLHGKLEHKAHRDPVTGLPNRKIFEVELARALTSSTFGQRRHHLCNTGVSHLSDIAQRFGNRAANTLLKRYASVLVRQVGKKGLVAHIGLGRFAVLLENIPRSEVMQILERHRRSVERARCVYRNHELQLAVSMGVVAIDPAANDVSLIMEQASAAYQTARAASPMGLHVEETPVGCSPRIAAPGGVTAASELIAANRLALRVQRVAPVDPESELKPYYEVLLGIRDANGCIGPPGSVIVAAERAGSIVELDRWVVAEVLSWMAGHNSALTGLKGFAINLSGTTLSDCTLARFVAEELENKGVAPDRIIFEVTESTAIERLSVAREFIESMQALGCRFAIDDFGTGHASFSYLKLLPVDTVKIDGLFVKDITSNAADEAMVRSINEIAKVLGKQTVAEFVQGDSALQCLRQIGVDYAQGYGIEQPIPIDELLSRPGRSDSSSPKDSIPPPSERHANGFERLSPSAFA